MLSVTRMFSLRSAEADEQIEAGDRRRARAGADELHVSDVLADQLEPVEDRRGGDDCGAVLVVMEHRNLHALRSSRLDVEAFRAP